EVERIAIGSDFVGWHVRQFLSQKWRMDSAVACGDSPVWRRHAEQLARAPIAEERAAVASGSCVGKRSALDSKKWRASAAFSGKKVQPGCAVRSRSRSQRGREADC